jgi:hypothetical protein
LCTSIWKKDLKFDPATVSGVRIGAGAVIREHVTVNRSIHAGGWTTVGAGAFLMAASHVGHDCEVGDHVVLANAVLLLKVPLNRRPCAACRRGLCRREGLLRTGGPRGTACTLPLVLLPRGPPHRRGAAVGRQVLQPMAFPLRKLSTFVPDAHLETLRQAMFEAGAGHVGKYAGCSFVSSGTGSFTAGEGTNPFAGTKGKPHFEAEQKLELIFQAHLEQRVLETLFRTHPYEEVAYDILRLENSNMSVGSGLVGSFAEPMDERALLDMVSRTCNIPVIRHSPLTGRKVKRIAICGGSGSFLIPKAIAAGVDAFLTADLKYHDFFEPGGRMLLADIGHYEGEQFTTALLYDLIREKFHTFAVQKTAFPSNPVNYHQ